MCVVLNIETLVWMKICCCWLLVVDCCKIEIFELPPPRSVKVNLDGDLDFLFSK